MGVTEAARNGMGAKTALRIWGEIVQRNQGIYPQGWGWPSMSIEGRLKAYGPQGAKEGTALAVDSNGDPVLTRPEEAVDRLHSDLAIAAWVAGILKDASPPHRIYATLNYVKGWCWADIAERLETDHDGVEAMNEAIKARVRRALRALLPVVQAA